MEKNREILNNPKILENEFKITCYLIKENNRQSEEKDPSKKIIKNLNYYKNKMKKKKSFYII